MATAALVDASAMVAAFGGDQKHRAHYAELLKRVAKEDVRDFSRYRLADGRAFEIL